MILKIKKPMERRMSKFSIFCTKFRIYLPVLSITTLVLFIFSIYLNEYILFILNQRFFIPFMKENIKRDTLNMKLGIFTILENENLIFSTKILFCVFMFFMVLFFYSFFKTILIDPGYLPDPVNFEFNLILQNLEIKEDHEFISYEESESSNANNNSMNIALDSGSNLTNSNNNNLTPIKSSIKAANADDKIKNQSEIMKNEIFEEANIINNTTNNKLNENQINLDNSNEKEILFNNNNDLSNNGIYSDISANNEINNSPQETIVNKKKSSKKAKNESLISNTITEEENAYVVHKNNIEENDVNANVDNSKITITSNINNSSNENHKFNSSAASLKENENLKNNFIKKDENNSNEYLIEENTSYQFNNLNIENLKEKNDYNIIIHNKEISPNNNINDSPRDEEINRDIITKARSSKKRISKSQNKIYKDENSETKNVIYNNNSITINNNFTFFTNQENDKKLISPISGNITDNSSLSKVNQDKNQLIKTTRHHHRSSAKGTDKKMKISKKRFSSMKNKNNNFPVRKNYSELNVKNYLNDRDLYSRKFSSNELMEVKGGNSKNFISDSSEFKDNETSSIPSVKNNNFFNKILKMRNNFIKDFGKIVANGPICTSEGVKYRNYLEKYLNFNNFPNSNISYRTSYFHSLLYSQSII